MPDSLLPFIQLRTSVSTHFIIYPLPLCQIAGSCPRCYNASMTLMEITYELQSRLTPEQLRALGSFANTYGLRRFRVDEKNNRLSFEYDASRLREIQVTDVLRQA